MSPTRHRARRAAWRAPRPRRELATAVLVGAAVLLLTVVAVWALQPREHKPGVAPVPVTTTTKPGRGHGSRPPSTTQPAPSSSSAPARASTRP